MTKEEFIQQKEELHLKISHYKKELETLKEDYIHEHREFNDGEKIVIITPEHTSIFNGKEIPESRRHAFIKDAFISYFNDIEYNYRKCKKNGQAAVASDYVGRNNIITSL